MAEQIFFAVNVDTGKAIPGLASLKGGIQNVQKSQKDLNKRFKEGSITSKAFASATAKNDIALKQLRTQYNKAQKAALGFNKTQKSFSGKIAGQVTKNLAGIAAGVTAGILAFRQIARAVSASIDKFDQQAKAEKALEVALGKTSQALLDQASALQKVTIFGDEAIIQSQALLAQFGLTEDQLLQLTPALLDFSAAQGIGLTDAAKLLSKSLGSSTNALTRYGIEITGAVGSQERLDTAITNLSSKFAGQAEAATVGAGKLQQFENLVGDLQEKIGGLIVRGITPFVNGLSTLVSNVSDFLKPSQEMQNELAGTQVALNKELEVLKSGNLSQEARRVLIDRINKSYGEYLPNLITEKTTLAEINTIQEAANKLITQRIITQAFQKELTEILKLQKDALLSVVDVEIIQEENRQDAATNQDERLANARTQQNKQLDLFKDINKGIAGDTDKNLQKVEDRYRKLSEAAGILFDDILNSINATTAATETLGTAITTTVQSVEEGSATLQQIPSIGTQLIETSNNTAEVTSKNAVDFVAEQQSIAAAEADLLSARIQASGQLTAVLANAAAQNSAVSKGLFAASRAFAIADIIVSLQGEIAGISFANSKLGAFGAPLTIAQIAAAKIRAAIGVATVLAQSIGRFQDGGIVNGPSHAQGGVPMFARGGAFVGEMEGGEAIMSRGATKKFGPQLSAMNQAGGGRKFQEGGVAGVPNIALESGTDSANIQLQRTLRNVDFSPQVSVREINIVDQRVKVIEEAGRL